MMGSLTAFGVDLPSISLIVLHSLEGSILCLHELSPCFSQMFVCLAGKVGSLDLRSSRALILSNISAGTGSVLIRCRSEGICCNAAFRMRVHKIFSPFWHFVGSIFFLVCPLSPYDIGPSLASLR